jgi:D-3-phosphoglycerate dehydrogenase
MSRFKLLYYEVSQFCEKNQRYLDNFFDVQRLPDPNYDTDKLLAGIDAVFAPLGFTFDQQKMERCPTLKAIASNTTSTPHIDLQAAASRGLRVISLADQQEFLKTITPTAEHTWGLLFSLMRRIPWAHQAVCQGKWDRRDFGARRMLSAMSLGIVGLGRLGRMVARQGLAFGMQVAYYDPHVDSGPAAEIKRYGALVDLLQNSDVVSLHVSSTPETKGLIGEHELSLMRSGSYLVNTARGELIEQTALLDALEHGRIAGAALDVLEQEVDAGRYPDLAAHPLVRFARSHDTLVLTPHIGGSTEDAWYKTEHQVIERLIGFFQAK